MILTAYYPKSARGAVVVLTAENKPFEPELINVGVGKRKANSLLKPTHVSLERC